MALERLKIAWKMANDLVKSRVKGQGGVMGILILVVTIVVVIIVAFELLNAFNGVANTLPSQAQAAYNNTVTITASALNILPIAIIIAVAMFLIGLLVARK